MGEEKDDELGRSDGREEEAGREEERERTSELTRGRS